MQKLLIIKTGTTYPSIGKKVGDFDDFIINQIGISRREVIVVSVYENKILPEPGEISAIIITGSHSMVTDLSDWSVYTSQWLRGISHKLIPTLGICYGRQLIAHAYGGVVDYHSEGEENGTVNIELTEAGKRDPLFKVLPSAFLGHALHAQTVVKLPVNAHILARNSFDPHQGFSLSNKVWGVQFHPEFNAEIVRMYIEEEKELLVQDGYDFDVLYRGVQENPYGEILLKRFIELA